MNEKKRKPLTEFIFRVWAALMLMMRGDTTIGEAKDLIDQLVKEYEGKI